MLHIRRDHNLPHCEHQGPLVSPNHATRLVYLYVRHYFITPITLGDGRAPVQIIKLFESFLGLTFLKFPWAYCL